ncbi:MAG: putative Methylene tetrahydromethanopterin dehydrogenase (MtdB) [Promethearchaeota archaeon]|nr:MAG: putative Methylene tetrahydromethanopterin dehydrogenase (MtdB) [Candidatus Lokiarchaeota archaeon]
MEVLELEPLKKKKLKLVMVESEFPIDWWFEGPVQKKHDLVWNLNLISKEYLELVRNLVDKYEPDFAVEEKGSRWDETISKEDPVGAQFKELGIPYQMVDISENAENYLSAALDKTRDLIKSLGRSIQEVLNNNNTPPEDNYEFQRMILLREYLQKEYSKQEYDVRYKVREAWMMMRILNIAREIDQKKVNALFICDKDHFSGISELANELGVDIQEIEVKKTPQIKNNTSDSIENMVNQSILELSPIKVKKKKQEDKICYFFDTDENASPFDINMAYDAGFDVVVPISKMTAKEVPKLVQDAIFSRKPKAPTTFFIGGANVKEGEKIAEKVQKSLVPPFECPVIIDPRGSHTTASSVVAKTMEVAMEHGIDELSGKKVVILGAGPVARIAAILAAKMNCKTCIVETWEQSSEETIKNLVVELNREAGEKASEITGIFAPEDGQRLEIVKDAEIIWALAAAGVEVLSKEIMEELSGNKLVVDINLVPPYGVKGLKPKHNNEEIYPGIFGTGALALGRLKSNTESMILKEAANTKGKKIFDYKYAFKVAKKILFGSKISIKN